MCHVCVGVRRAYRTGWAEMGGACFADEKPDADGRSLGMRARRWVGSGLARVCNNYSIPRVEISHIYINQTVGSSKVIGTLIVFLLMVHIPKLVVLY